MAPWSSELFEFNKILLTYGLTAVIVTAWLIKMILAKKIVFQRTFWDTPLILFLLSQGLSFVFSIDRHTSWWGYYGRFNGGLLSLISYLLLYWAFVSNMTKKNSQRYALRPMLISATLVALYGIAEHYGIDAQHWVQDVRRRVFSTLGQPNWLAAYLVALIPFTLNPKRYTLSAILFICLLFTKSRSGLLGFGAAYLIFWGFNFAKQKNKIVKPFLLITFLLSLITIFVGTPWGPRGLATRQTVKNTPGVKNSDTPRVSTPLISESGDIRRVVWRGAIDIWQHHPLVGTGPETFAYAYFRFRPREHNDLSEWDFLYNKAHNEYLNYLATTGAIGLGAYLLLIISFLRYALNTLHPQGVRSNTPGVVAALLAGFTSILVTNFFGFSVVPVSLLFFLLPALAAVKNRPTIQSPKTRWRQKIIIAAILASCFFILYSLAQIWIADSRLATGNKLIKAGQYDDAFNTLWPATKTRPNEPIYHNALATAASGLAVTAYQQEQLESINQFINAAIESSNRALAISPYQLIFWKNRVKIFYQLAKIDPQYSQKAIESLQHAGQLAPTDAKIKYNLGLLYFSQKQNDQAIKVFEKALELKPNYREAQQALDLLKK